VLYYNHEKSHQMVVGLALAEPASHRFTPSLSRSAPAWSNWETRDGRISQKEKRQRAGPARPGVFLKRADILLLFIP